MYKKRKVLIASIGLFVLAGSLVVMTISRGVKGYTIPVTAGQHAQTHTSHIGPSHDGKVSSSLPQARGHKHTESIPLHQIGASKPTKVSTLDSGLPTWSSSFTYSGQTYSYKMVGTDPHLGSATTVIPIDLVPLIFTFADGSTLDGTSRVQDVLNSPMFQKNQYATGDTTQFVDALMREEFWSSVSTKSPDYHLLLGQPIVQPSVKLNIPAQTGEMVSGNGFIDQYWLMSQLDQPVTASGRSASHLMIFISNNTTLYDASSQQGNVGGYHTAVAGSGSGEIYTYAYLSVDPPAAVKDAVLLSHELAEWANDPFPSSIVPQWTGTGAACSDELEVGDPLDGNFFIIGDYEVQDIVFFSWLARETPSQGFHGQYDLKGLFQSPANPSGCPPPPPPGTTPTAVG